MVADAEVWLLIDPVNFGQRLVSMVYAMLHLEKSKDAQYSLFGGVDKLHSTRLLCNTK
jgi:hypothetical protein